MANVVRNIDKTEGVGFFASICDAPPDTNQQDAPKVEGTGVPEGETHDCQ